MSRKSLFSNGLSHECPGVKSYLPHHPYAFCGSGVAEIVVVALLV
jgi:hypothetical protein